MKKPFLFLLLLATAFFARTQTVISAINITLPANPDAYTANWGTGTSPFIITAAVRMSNGHIDASAEDARLLLTIKKDGKKVCGSYTPATAPPANFNSVSAAWSGPAAVALLGQDCTLPPGDYELSVQFFASGAAAPVPISEERTKPFTIMGADGQTYQGPQAIAPANGTALGDRDIQKPITFRWTPVVPPAAQNDVVYHLRVYELLPGQQPIQAVKGNSPVLEKEVKTTQYMWPLPADYKTAAGAKTFVWGVQATNKDGKAYGPNNGTSEIWKIIESPTLSAYVNGSKATSTITDCTIQFSFSHPFGGATGGYNLKVIDVTVNPMSCGATCPGSACGELCTTTPVLNYQTNSTSLNIAFNNATGTSTDVNTGDPVIPAVNNPLIPGHQYMIICCVGSGQTNISSNCVSFLYNGCANTGSCACASAWPPLLVTQTSTGGGTNNQGLKNLGQITQYKCDDKIYWQCNQPFNFKSSYTCTGNGQNCQAAITWQVTLNGVVKQSGSGTGPLNGSFTPVANGAYVLTLNATCNGKACGACIYTIIVENCKVTDCGCADAWPPLQVIQTVTGGGTNNQGKDLGQITTYKCGAKIEWKCNQPFNFKSSYACTGGQNCQAAITWQVQLNGGGVIQSGTGTGALNGSFTPVGNGTYTLTLSATCNGKTCNGCSYSIIVKNCKGTDCTCGSWGTLQVTQSTGGPRENNTVTKYDCGAKIPWHCNMPFNFTNTFTCNPAGNNCVAKTSWQVTKDGFIVQSGEDYATFNGSFTPVTNGEYIITLNSSCNGVDCPSSCKYAVEVEDCKVTACDCNPDMYVVVQQAGGAAVKIKCGATNTFDYGSTITITPQNICSTAGCMSDWKINVYDAQTGTFITGGSGVGSTSTMVLTLNSLAGYKLDLTADCNGKKCTCEFWIRPKQVAGCKCSDSWGAFTVKGSDIKYICGDKIPWKCNTPFSFTANYQCITNSADCKAIITWQVTKDGSPVQSGSGTGSTSGSFVPATNGIYTLTLNATCNGVTCKACTYTIVADGCTVVTCDPCKTSGVTLTNDALTITASSSDQILLSGTLSGLDAANNAKVTIELVALNIKQTGDKECAKCSENKEWGNFIPPATASFTGFAPPVLNGGNFGREWTWVSQGVQACTDAAGNGGPGSIKSSCAGCSVPAGKASGSTSVKSGAPGAGTGSNTFSLPISLPAGSSLSCCSDEVTICIRYTWWDACCHACDMIKCYVLQRKPVTIK